ncbi:MAG: hypothetical protein IPF59_07935 [Ignavibacteria bacterium]|nr:hypothetical protein [Ignavibacteria bacterium]MBK6420260.1 hypothetical protein [Ignavibacteria bacterium]MBK6759106.1 hypothetical protein [Ignavibacteria bacterium]MBK7412790.1 hypothetical protein [Ignavibacteria bacterium]MBP7093845.1 hypothetical protein [Candidatus Kapabacteria bacterium]
MISWGVSLAAVQRGACGLAFLLSTVLAVAQEERPADSSQSTPLVTVTGNASITADFYDHSSDPPGSQAGRRPAQLYRLVFSPTITLGGLISLPFNIMLTLPETNTTTPTIQSPSFGQYITNPANAFGFSSFAPRIGWAQFFLGSHTPQYSTLSNSDLPLFGAGIDFQPLGLRIAASGGVVQRAVEPDSSRGTPATYRRDVYMGRIGTASNDSLTFGLNVVYARDDVSSIQNNVVTIIPQRTVDGDSTIILPADTIRLRPEEGMMASVDVVLGLAKGMNITAEAAVSSFTRDQTSDVKSIDGNPLDLVTTTRVSTRVDLAGTASFNVKSNVWGFSVTTLYMGAGYVPIAQPYQQSDRFEWKVAPSLQLFGGDVAINATVGHRINNLSGTKGETLSQAIYGGTVNAQFSDGFSTMFRYSNFGIRNKRDLDTLRVENVSQSFGIDPSLMIDGEDVLHTLNASLGLDTYDDFNVVSGIESSNDMRSAIINYLGSIKPVPLSVGVNASYVENILFTGLFIVRSVGGMIAYRFLNGDVVPSVSITNSSTTFGPSPSDQQLFFKASVRWRITKTTAFLASYGNNNYTYGNPSSRSTAFTERMIQLALSTSF